MAHIRLFLAGCLLIVGAMSNQLDELTDINFMDNVDNHPERKWFINVYVAWGQACTNFRPYWEALVASDTSDVHFGQINAMEERLLASRFQTDRYPTLLFVFNGTMIDYFSPRKTDDIRDFLAGGYKSYDVVPLPSYPSPLLVHIEKYVQSLNERLSHHALLVFFFVFFCGMLIGVLYTYIALRLIFDKRDTTPEECEEDNAEQSPAPEKSDENEECNHE